MHQFDSVKLSNLNALLANMKISFVLFFVIATLSACEVKTKISQRPIEGTWKLITGTLIEKGDTTVTDYTRDREMVKIINATHFSFLNHDTNKGRDTTQLFAAGGGKYSFDDGAYTEFLEYCSDSVDEEK